MFSALVDDRKSILPQKLCINCPLWNYVLSFHISHPHSPFLPERNGEFVLIEEG